ncbi:MAG: hypothetical protein KatS3mg005_1593 [Bryobacteraceae bacterium]|nr:MAG: hypothetical protein KatS3mg005_1593 [Bryobacteraceae bacterium]
MEPVPGQAIDQNLIPGRSENRAALCQRFRFGNRRPGSRFPVEPADAVHASINLPCRRDGKPAERSGPAARYDRHDRAMDSQGFPIQTCFQNCIVAGPVSGDAVRRTSEIRRAMLPARGGTGFRHHVLLRYDFSQHLAGIGKLIQNRLFTAGVLDGFHVPAKTPDRPVRSHADPERLKWSDAHAAGQRAVGRAEQQPQRPPVGLVPGDRGDHEPLPVREHGEIGWKGFDGFRGRDTNARHDLVGRGIDQGEMGRILVWKMKKHQKAILEAGHSDTASRQRPQAVFLRGGLSLGEAV